MKSKVTPKEFVDRLLNEAELYEMSSLHAIDTGLPFALWVPGDRKDRHSRPRGKVKLGGKEYPFSIDEPVGWLIDSPSQVKSKDFKKLQAFVRLNREVLLLHWQDKISSIQMGPLLKKV